MNTSSQENNYFDLHTTGIGYLGRIREVNPKNGTPFLACTIAALTGKSNAPEYQYFDVRVSGSDAQHLVRRCVDAVEEKKHVLIRFRLGDTYPDLFTYTKGDKKGQQGINMKGRLLHISWIKVEGEMVYKVEPKPQENDTVCDNSAAIEANSIENSSQSASLAHLQDATQKEEL